MTEFVWWWYRVFYSHTLLSRQNLLYHEILLVQEKELQGLTFARALPARRVNKWPLFLVGRGAAGPDESREERWGSKQIQHKCFPRQGKGPQNFRSQGQSGSERARALTWAGVSRPQVRLVGARRMVTTWGLRRQTGLTDSRLCCSRQTNASISLSLHLCNRATSYGVCEALGRRTQSTQHWGHLLVSEAPGRARTGRPAHGSTGTAEAPASDPGAIDVQHSPSQLSSNSLGKPRHGFEEGCCACTRFPL